MVSVYTGEIHGGCLKALFYNADQDYEFGCDEFDLDLYISALSSKGRQEHIQALIDLQTYKIDHGIELDHPFYFTREGIEVCHQNQTQRAFALQQLM